MHKYKTGWMLATLAMVMAPLAAFGATIEDVEKQVREARKKFDTLTAKVEQHTTTKQMGAEMTITAKGTLEAMNKDDKELSRMEMSMKMEMAGGGHQMEGKMVTVSDGVYAYALNDMMGMKNVVKQKAENTDLPWQPMKEQYDLKVLPDEKLDGQDVFVVEATPKQKEAEGPSRMVFYVRKDLGVAVKTVVYGADKEPMSTTTVSDIKTGVELSPERFKFEVPEGAQVMDMTAQGQE